MTEKSYFWFDDWATGDGNVASFTDDDYSDILRKMFLCDRTKQSVVANYGNNLAVSNPAGTTIRVASGAAIVDGKFYESTANVDFSVIAPGAGTNYYQVVLQKSWAGQTVRLALLGPSAVTYPTLTQTDATTWEVSIAKVSITAASAITITDTRFFAGGGLGNSVKIGEFVPGAVATYTVPEIPSYCKNVRLFISGYLSGADVIAIRFNADSGNNYGRNLFTAAGDDTLAVGYSDATSYISLANFKADSNQNNALAAVIYGAQISKYKTVMSESGYVHSTAAGSFNLRSVGHWKSANAITSLTIFTVGGATFSAGTVISVYADI